MSTFPPKRIDKQSGQVTAPMSLVEARKVLWPFRPYKNHMMGRLVDTKQLSLKDLLYAIENAWDIRVRQAAMTLMLVRLDQTINKPEPPAGFLHVVSGGRSYAQQRQYLYTLLEGIFIGSFLGAFVVLEIWLLSSRSSEPSNPTLSRVIASPTGIIGLAIALVLTVGVTVVVLFSVNKIMSRLDKEIDNHRKGEEGEDRAMATISQVLDGNWFAFRNVLLPGRKQTDLDVVLVGTNGVWLLEIKYYTREYRNIGDQWEYGAGSRWKPARSNPSRQARKNAGHLGNFLRADGIEQWVVPVVVWANPECRVKIENPSVAVWTLENLPDALVNTGQNRAMSEDSRQRIIDKLTKLCERQKASQKEKER